jgi:hypothetical protein
MEGTLTDKLKLINRLASRKDDPEAWSELASAYRIKVLRGPLEDAMAQVGWEKIAALVRYQPGGWPPELRGWLEGQAESACPKKGPIQSIHDRAYSEGDYGTEVG